MPHYQNGQKVWLSSKDLALGVESHKLFPRFISPFPISKVVGPAVVHLNLFWTMRIHSIFLVTRVKPSAGKVRFPMPSLEEGVL